MSTKKKKKKRPGFRHKKPQHIDEERVEARKRMREMYRKGGFVECESDGSIIRKLTETETEIMIKKAMPTGE
jgi:hypothetical protein